MKYKNISDEVLKFRANDSNGIKKVFLLKPGEEMESDREVRFGGLELVKQGLVKDQTKSKLKGDEE